MDGNSITYVCNVCNFQKKMTGSLEFLGPFFDFKISRDFRIRMQLPTFALVLVVAGC